MLSPIKADGFGGIAHGFFGRTGGVSSGLYASLNCGLGSKDDRTNVVENRSRVARTLGTSGDRLLTCYQIHSADAVIVDRPWGPDGQPKADALVTKTPGLAIGALAADCTPILFADPAARVIGAAHAGWKGAKIGIAEATIAAMEKLGARRDAITAAIGPCISQANYEVGAEFEAAFLDESPENARFFKTPAPGAKPHFDLPSYIAARLKAAQVGRIERLDICTYASDSQFFSFRRTTHRREGDYGRQISAIVLA